jgi:UDP-GlcNAc:undecaprenyl-phosphate GlcNAc-1-phosphate transferase
MLELLVAFLGAMALTPMLREPAYRAGLVDRPAGRKNHHGHVPVVGGIAMVATFLCTALLLGPAYAHLLPLLVVTLAIATVGVIDDRIELPAAVKLAAQVLLATLAVQWGGQSIVTLGDLFGAGPVELGAWSTPFTVFAMIGVMNALNMIDGLDGLAGGVAVIAMAWLASVAVLTGNLGQVDVLLLWLGALAGFLLFNLRYPFKQRARVFMGDAGSLALGLTLAWFCVDLTQGIGTDGLYPISALWIVAVPVMDTLYLMLRRTFRRGNPFAPDRRHIHHTLLIMGLREGSTVSVVLALSALLGAVGVLGWLLGVPEAVLGYGFVVMLAVYCSVMQWWRPISRAFGIAAVRIPAEPRPASGEVGHRHIPS